SLDTPAHRWIAAGLDAALARASALRAAEGARPGSLRRTVVVDELDRLRGLLARSRRIEPLREAGAPPPAAAPLSLRLRPAYSEAADALATLHGALRIGEGAVSVSTQDVGALYETWAALETVAAFARAVGAEAPARPFGARAVGTDIYLQRGPRYSVRLVGEHVEVEVVRAPRFEGPPALLVQVPDLLVVVRVPGRPDRRVVLDAKYRLAEGVGRRGTPAPPGDALGALHRYRDAIVGPDGRRGYVDTAVALYPARPGGDYETSRLWTSIEAIGVGGVPLLPGESGWLDRFARRVVSGAG
ncbi:MAG TPA: nuclease domain-containing protein, partial [Rubricoccaceae bacterium]